ncbi:class I SAM-dependent methyltransferase [Rhizobium laguerreae]|uniref:class I SAM-dependent methyltransferase n=1 Tax=Rhizobium laguerreae TaxID=1076926 RepID=UPI001C9237CC|nr:class I SAM-dependent methyltransferase [Rhizobium laguerreae]MBY3152895.1 class I SAM-dependent methyltransferase [Rhizobium laguerreae]
MKKDNNDAMKSDHQMQCIACGSNMETFIERISDDRYGCPGVYSIKRCVSCGHMTTTPPLTEEDLPGLYSTYYPRREVDFSAIEREAALVNKPFAAFNRWMAGTDHQGHYLAQPGEKVLDVGCGSCISLLEMRNKGIESWGIEADPNVRTIADHFGLQVHIGNIYDLPFPDMKFDLIVLNQVLEHVPDPSAMLQAVRKRLTPQGRVIMAFPNTGSFHHKIWKDRWINWHIPYHQNHFNRTSFTKLAGKFGYKVESVRTVTPNLWSVLQLRTARERKQEGKSSSTWTHNADAIQARPPFFTRLKNVALSRGARGAGMVMGLGNRILDAAGKGDSLLFVLRPT